MSDFTRAVSLELVFEAEASGLTFDAFVSKDGGNFVAAGGVVTPLSGGDEKGYLFTSTTDDTDADTIVILCVGSDGSQYVSGNLSSVIEGGASPLAVTVLYASADAAPGVRVWLTSDQTGTLPAMRSPITTDDNGLVTFHLDSGVTYWVQGLAADGSEIAAVEVTGGDATLVVNLPAVTTPETGYASIADLEAYLGVTAPADAAGMILRASDLIDAVTYNRIDVTDADAGDAWAIAARKAVCAQVKHWIDNGESAGTEGIIASKTVSKTSVSYVQGSTAGNGHPELSPIARRVLLSAGLLYRGAWVR